MIQVQRKFKLVCFTFQRFFGLRVLCCCGQDLKIFDLESYMAQVQRDKWHDPSGKRVQDFARSKVFQANHIVVCTRTWCKGRLVFELM
jgi:hypothetical protein